MIKFLKNTKSHGSDYLSLSLVLVGIVAITGVVMGSIALAMQSASGKVLKNPSLINPLFISDGSNTVTVVSDTFPEDWSVTPGSNASAGCVQYIGEDTPFPEIHSVLVDCGPSRANVVSYMVTPAADNINSVKIEGIHPPQNIGSFLVRVDQQILIKNQRVFYYLTV